MSHLFAAHTCMSEAHGRMFACVYPTIWGVISWCTSLRASSTLAKCKLRLAEYYDVWSQRLPICTEFRVSFIRRTWGAQRKSRPFLSHEHAFKRSCIWEAATFSFAAQFFADFPCRFSKLCGPWSMDSVRFSSSSGLASLAGPAGFTGLDQYFSRRFDHHSQRFTEVGAPLYAVAKKVYRAQKIKCKIYNDEGERVLVRHHHNLNRQMNNNVAKLKAACSN